MTIFIFLLIFFPSVCNAMEQEQHFNNNKKKQLVTLFDIHGKFFQRDIEDVKAVLPPLFEYELNVKRNNEQSINCIALNDVAQEYQPLLTKEKLKSIFSLYDVLKTKPKSLDRQQRKALEAANDFFIIGNYFGIDSSHIDHLKFLITRYCDPELNQNEYRYSAIELFQKGLLTKDDVLTPFDEHNNNLGITLTELHLTFDDIIACIPCLEYIEKNFDLTFDNQNELIFGMYYEQFNTLVNRKNWFGNSYLKLVKAGFIKDYSYSSQKAKNLEDCNRYLNLSKLNINSLLELSIFLQKLKSHKARCLNMSNLNIGSSKEFNELVKYISFTEEELKRIQSINLNNNRLEELPTLFYRNTFYSDTYENLTKVTAKHNQIRKVVIMTDPDFRCGKMLLALENIHLNISHNQLKQLPRITEHTSHAVGKRMMLEKRFAHFGSLNVKDNPLSLKTRSLIRSPQNNFALFAQKAAFYAVAHFLYYNSPIAKFFLLNDISHSETVIISGKFKGKYKRHLVPNDPYNQMSTPSLFCFSRIGSLFPSFFFFLSRHCNSKKIPTHIKFDRKNRCLEITEDTLGLLYQSCKDVHQDTNTFHKMYRVWNAINVPCYVLQ